MVKPHQRKPVIEQQYYYWSRLDGRYRVTAKAAVTQDCYPRQQMVLERKLARKSAMKQLLGRKESRAQHRRRVLALDMERALAGIEP